QVERLWTLVARARLELDLLTLAQLVELDARRQLRAMEEDVVGAVVGGDQAESLVAHDPLDGAGHSSRLLAAVPRGGTRSSRAKAMARTLRLIVAKVISPALSCMGGLHEHPTL